MSRERAMLAGVRVYFQNREIQSAALTVSSRPLPPSPGEVTAYVLDPGVYVSLPAGLDKRNGGARKPGAAS